MSKKHSYFVREGELSPLLCELLSRLDIAREQILAVNQQTTEKIIQATHKAKTRSNTIDLGAEFEENKPEVESEKVKPEIVTNQDFFAEEKKFDPNMGDHKFKTDFQVPILKTGNAEEIEDFIFALRYADELGALTTTNLIYQVLVRSNREDLLKTLSKEALSSCDKFFEFLKLAYGESTDVNLWIKLGRMRQKPGESEYIFYQRLLSVYFACKNKAVPEKVAESDQAEITFRFINGLADSAVQSQMWCNRQDYTFDDLVRKAKKLRESMAIKNAEVTVNAISRRFQAEVSFDDDMCVTCGQRVRGRGRDRYRHNRSHSRSRDRRSRERSYSRDRSNSRARRRENCVRCGYVGHTIADCVASERTVRKYQERQRRDQDVL